MSLLESTKQTQQLVEAEIVAALRDGLKPPPDLKVSEWADAHRRLSSEASAAPGRWMTSRAEYQRGIMDAASDPSTHMVVMMTSAQVGKTSIIENIIGFHIDQDPCPILAIQPSLDMAHTFSKDRLAPMVRDTPCLTAKVSEVKSRDKSNTVLHKQFAGGHITIGGANSPTGLASRPIRLLLLDEVDRYPPSAGTEGDPSSLAIKRTTTFWNRLIIMASTPTIEGVSQIAARYAQSDRRRFHVPCPDCGQEQTLRWAQVKWRDDDPTNAEYVCEHCGSIWDDVTRWGTIRKGRWIAEAPFRGVAGFHLSELYSPWVKLADMARGFLEAKGDPQRLKTWINTSLGETWKEEYSAQADASELQRRAGQYEMLSVPEGGLLLTASVDVQDNRLEFLVRAWGRDERSWLVNYGQIYGDPSKLEIWNQLDGVLMMPYRHVSGSEMYVKATCVDSGGHYTQEVYEYCRTRAKHNIVPIKGMQDPKKPIIGPPSKVDIQFKGVRMQKGVALYPVGPNAAKSTIYGRLKEPDQAKPGSYHWPQGMPPEYFTQLTSEQKSLRTVNGQTKVVWLLKSGQRNEALDLEAYALAALHYLYARTNKPTMWDRLEKALSPKAVPAKTEPQTQTEASDQPPAAPMKTRHRVKRGAFSRGR